MGEPKPKSLLCVDLPCDRTAPRLARAALSSVLDSGSMRNDAVLVASELVTNAVQFSGCIATEQITLDAERARESLRLRVHDPGRTAATPRLREADTDRIGGQGLRIVARLARRWGVETCHGGRCVWADLPI